MVPLRKSFKLSDNRLVATGTAVNAFDTLSPAELQY